MTRSGTLAFSEIRTLVAESGRLWGLPGSSIDIDIGHQVIRIMHKRSDGPVEVVDQVEKETQHMPRSAR